MASFVFLGIKEFSNQSHPDIFVFKSLEIAQRWQKSEKTDFFEHCRKIKKVKVQEDIGQDELFDENVTQKAKK